MLLSGPFSGLLTDLYELTMAAGYVQNRFEARATFELFVRHLPNRRNYLVAAGLDDVLTCIEELHFTDDDLEYLAQQGFSTRFLDRLRGPLPEIHAHRTTSNVARRRLLLLERIT